MQKYDQIIIREFLVNHIDLLDFCFYLSDTLNRDYKYNFLDGNNSPIKSLALIEVAEKRDELGDLVFYILQYWLNKQGKISVIREEKMDTQLEVFLKELQEHGEQERAEQVTQMLLKILPPSEHNKILLQPAPAGSSAGSEWNQQRFGKKISERQQHLNLLDEKLTGLRKQHALETRPEEKLRIKHLIAETETECHQTEKELHDLNNQTTVRGSKR